MWVFYTRRGKEDARGISYLEEGAIQGFENPIRILGFLKKIPPSVGVRGGQIVVTNNLGRNPSSRDQCVQVLLILGHIYPQ